MLIKIKNILLFSAVVLFVSSCYEDADFENESTTEIFTPEVLEEKNGSVMGYVYDTENNPISNASVRIYSGSTETDEFGVFRFDNVKLDEHGTYLTVNHPDYILGSDFLYAKTGIAQARVQMVKLRTDVTFEAASGGTINVEKGGEIVFPANGIQDDSGNLYTGVVQVTSHHISALDENIDDLMPGSLLAQDSEGRTVSLGTAGMMAIELRSPSGEELNIMTGSSATIKLPVSQNGMPNEIPTWSFDENSGRWIEEGIALFDNGFYVFDVSHLSFWNCDYPFPLVSVSGRVVNEKGEPVLTRVGVHSDLYGVQYASTDSDGFFSGKVPAGETLQFFTKGYFCNLRNYSETLGPFDVTTVLTDFVVDRIPNIQGGVLCAGVPYSNATIIIEAEGQRYIYNSIRNGEFNYNPNLICDDITTGFIWAYDNVTKKTSPKYPIDFDNPDMPSLDVCEITCDFAVDVTYVCGGDRIDIDIVNPDGSYTYNWDSGETTNQINVSTTATGLYCLTVTEDVTGCEQMICQETGALDFDLWYSECYGDISIGIIQGSAPYDVTVIETGENFTIINNWGSVFAYDAGNYCIDITDKLGCNVQKCINVAGSSGFFPYMDSTPRDCQLNRYYYEAYDFDFATVSGPQGTDALQLDNLGYYINVAIVGYKDIRVELNGGPCFEIYTVTTPFFEGLQAAPTALNASCPTCLDGQIYFVFDAAATCNDCVFGEVRIFDADFNDLTLENSNATLGVGTYYVAALDQTTGCFIASHSIEIGS